MKNIFVKQIINYITKSKKLTEQEVDCIIIEFNKKISELVIDEEMINEMVFLHGSLDININFDNNGLIKNLEIFINSKESDKKEVVSIEELKKLKNVENIEVHAWLINKIIK